MLLPLIGYTLFSWLATLAKNLHNFIGPILIIAVPWMFVRYLRYNGIGIDDVKWFINIVDYFKGHEYPSGKFNAGEKLVFWFVLVLFSTILIVSGLVLVFPNFNQTRATMQVANVVHMIAAYLAMALACVHIYLGTIGMKGAYRAMRDGYVDESWAEHHHLRWYEEVVAGTAREKFVAARSRTVSGAQVAQIETGVTGSRSRRGHMTTTLRALFGRGFGDRRLRRWLSPSCRRAPPMDDKAKAAAEEKKAKDAATAEAVKLQQARAEDRVAAHYIAEQKAHGKTVTPQMGPTAASVAANSGPVGTNKGLGGNKPPEKASNAHSDPKTVR